MHLFLFGQKYRQERWNNWITVVDYFNKAILYLYLVWLGNIRYPGFTVSLSLQLQKKTPQGTLTICVCYRLLHLYWYIAKYVYKSMLNKRWITLPVVYCHPFASKYHFWGEANGKSSMFIIKKQFSSVSVQFIVLP